MKTALLHLPEHKQAELKAITEALIRGYTGKLEESDSLTPINPVSHDIEFVNHELHEGNYFFDEIS